MTRQPQIITIETRQDKVLLRQENYLLPENAVHASFTYKDDTRIAFTTRQELIQTLGGQLHNPQPDQPAVITKQSINDTITHHYYEHDERVIGPNGYAVEVMDISGVIHQGYMLNDHADLDLANPHQGAQIAEHLMRHQSNLMTQSGRKTLSKYGMTIDTDTAQETTHLLHVMRADQDEIVKSVPVNNTQEPAANEQVIIPYKYNS